MMNVYTGQRGGTDVRKTPFIGFYGYWVILTYLGVTSAIAGIVFAAGGNIRYAILCLMVCGLCDMLDGPVARSRKRTDREETFGIQLDSLADVITFGVFPAVIGYAIFSDALQGSGALETVVRLAVLVLYVLAALIRLAYFNVIEMELHSKDEERRYYEGLPVTSVALIIPVVYAVCTRFGFPLPEVYFVSLILLSAAFLVRVKIPKLRLRYLIGISLVGLPVLMYVLLSKGTGI
jgi:CDP-diacylglycerol--serine O-phosphatidyltransferase